MKYKTYLKIFSIVSTKIKRLYPGDVMDLTHDCFIKVEEGLSKSYKEIGKLEHWVYRLSVNCIIDFLKEKTARSKIAYIDQCQIDALLKSCEEYQLSSKVDYVKFCAENVYNSLNTLEEIHRDVLTLMAENKHNISRVSKIMGISRTAVVRAYKLAQDEIREDLCRKYQDALYDYDIPVNNIKDEFQVGFVNECELAYGNDRSYDTEENINDESDIEDKY